MAAATAACKTFLKVKSVISPCTPFCRTYIYICMYTYKYNILSRCVFCTHNYVAFYQRHTGCYFKWHVFSLINRKAAHKTIVTRVLYFFFKYSKHYKYFIISFATTLSPGTYGNVCNTRIVFPCSPYEFLTQENHFRAVPTPLS